MTQKLMFNEVKNFFQVFEKKGDLITGVKVPGSVQILGDIFAYNKGKIISGVIDKSVLVLAQKRKEGDRIVNFYSQKYDEKIRISLNEPQFKEENGWANFMSGVLFMLEGLSKKVSGMNVYIDNKISDLFNANSNEALEIGIIDISQKFSDWTLTELEIAEVCIESEKKFLAKEKYISKYIPAIIAKKDNLVYYDYLNKNAENVKIDLNNLCFVVFSSGIKKKQQEEKVNQIFLEIKEAVEILNRVDHRIEGLHNLNIEQFDELRSHLTIPQRKRCAYFISENERVENARVALQNGNIQKFIDIINDSEKNLKNRLELVDEENEILVDIIQDIPEVKAVRLINYGLDGSVITILEKDKIEMIESKVKKTFLTRTGLDLNTEIFTLNNEVERVNINIEDFKINKEEFKR